MKNLISTLLLSLLILPAFSQKQSFDYRGRMTPGILKDEIEKAKYITEIMPDFCRTFSLPFNEQKVSRRLRLAYYSQGYNIEQEEKYAQIMEFVSVEILTNSKGKAYSSTGTSDKLNEEQKSMLRKADLGSDIRIKILFKYKNPGNEKQDLDDKILEGQYTATIIPNQEAELHGGWKKFSEYMRLNLFEINTAKSLAGDISRATVQFTVNEAGQVTNTKLIRSSGNSDTDKLILEAINKMPLWEPAKNYMGLRVKQQFNISFGWGC